MRCKRRCKRIGAIKKYNIATITADPMTPLLGKGGVSRADDLQSDKDRYRARFENASPLETMGRYPLGVWPRHAPRKVEFFNVLLFSMQITTLTQLGMLLKEWSRRPGLNGRPAVYELL